MHEKPHLAYTYTAASNEIVVGTNILYFCKLRKILNNFANVSIEEVKLTIPSMPVLKNFDVNI